MTEMISIIYLWLANCPYPMSGGARVPDGPGRWALGEVLGGGARPVVLGGGAHLLPPGQ